MRDMERATEADDCIPLLLKEYLCAEHVDVPEDQTFFDMNDIKRKKLLDPRL